MGVIVHRPRHPNGDNPIWPGALITPPELTPYSFDCTYCPAKVGERCTDELGDVHPHMNRIDRAIEAQPGTVLADFVEPGELDRPDSAPVNRTHGTYISIPKEQS